MCALFAAMYPERTTALIMIGSFARRVWSEDNPNGATREEWDRFIDHTVREWGGPIGLEARAPSVADDPDVRDWWARFLRSGASPGAKRLILAMAADIDVRHVLPTISVPALVLHNARERAVPVELGRSLAARIPGARYLEFDAVDHLPWVGNVATIVDEIETFLTGVRPTVAIDRVLATVMFCDIVESTKKASEVGDRRWRDLLNAQQRLVRAEVSRYRGRELDTAGDGFFAAFDGPARGIRAAFAISDAVRRLGLDVRIGLHTGECEVLGNKLAGIAVHIGARVAASAAAGEVLASSTVKDLVAGSGIGFESRGIHILKGVPGEWPLFMVTTA